LKYTWIEIEVQKDADTSTYRGKILSSVLNEIISGTYGPRFFEMDCVHWTTETEDEVTGLTHLGYRLYGSKGRLADLNGKTFLQCCDVREISLLSDNYESVLNEYKYHNEE